MLPENISARHDAIAATFAERVAGVEDWDAPSPVAGWSARDIVVHLTSWLPGFLDGLGVDFPEISDADPASAFATQTRHVRALLEAPDAGREVILEPMGAMALDVLLDRFYIADVFMHTWDLARASGQPDRLDGDFARELFVGMRAIEPMLRASGQFGEQQPVPDDADPTDQLIAFIGRDPRWTPGE